MNDFVWDEEAQGRLQEFIKGIGGALGSDSRRASFGLYALGLLGEGERKSMEPIAARCCCDPDEVGARHQQLQHFVTNAGWSDREVRLYATRHAVSAMTEREPVVGWIVDDTGFLKQGTHSVGVQRQYTGSAGKVANVTVQPGVAGSREPPADRQIPRSFRSPAEGDRQARKSMFLQE